MIPVSTYPLPVHEILLYGLSFLALTRLLWKAEAIRRSRLVAVTAVVGITLTGLSGTLEHRRHAGTRIQITYGWPKPMYVTWLADERSPRGEAIAGRGIVENLFFYTALASLLVITASRLR